MKARMMKWILVMVLICGAALTTPLPVSAAVRFGGGFFVGRPWGWYRPYYWPYYGSYYYAPYAYSNAGQVKLETNVKDAEVFINGAYAGTAHKLKSMWLRPDTYDLEIRAPGRAPFAERIYVVASKTLHIRADLRVE